MDARMWPLCKPASIKVFIDYCVYFNVIDNYTKKKVNEKISKGNCLQQLTHHIILYTWS